MVTTISPIVLPVPPSRRPRSPGVHLSGIIRCIAAEAGLLTEENLEELSLLDQDQESWWEGLDQTSKFRIGMGLAWEEWYVPQIPEVVDHPGEFQLDGVFMTHDGESLTYWLQDRRHRIKVHECKYTYKSMRTVGWDPQVGWDPTLALKTQWMWVSQCKSYAKGLGTNLAALHVMFACGNYKRPIRPQGWRFDIEFTDEELDANWSLMTDYRDHLLCLESGEEP